MLVISRKKNESLVISNDIIITVVEIRGDKVRLGIVSPKDSTVHREEVWEAIHGPKASPEPPPAPSPEEAAFLRLILEDPEDDSPRLVFADWLEERGNPRGEFIRLQCQLAQLPLGDASRRELRDREQVLWEKHAGTWRAALPPVLQAASFERGFVASVSLSLRQFLAESETIFAAAPVRSLRLTSYWELPSLDDVAALAASPHLERLTALDCSAQAFGDEGAALLAASSRTGALRSLVLRVNRIQDAGAVALANSTSLEGLTSLDLSDNQIGADGVRALASSPHLRNRLCLVLSNNRLTGDEKAAFQARLGGRVRL